jgi:autotransporter-associated beta strand protein
VKPTAADDVIFDSNSGNVTIDAGGSRYCRSLNMTSGTGNYSGTLAHTGSTALYIGDATAGADNVALKFVAGANYTIGDIASQIYFFSTYAATPQTIDFAGFNTGRVNFGDTTIAGNYQLTGTWGTNTVNPAMTVTFTKGTLDTNGQTVYWGLFDSSNSNTRTLTLGASAITLYGSGSAWNVNVHTNLTLNSDTSIIDLVTAATSPRWGIDLTYYDVRIVASNNFSAPQNSGGNVTFNKLTITGTAVKGAGIFLYGSRNHTVTGELKLIGNSSTNRLLVYGYTLGAPSTFVVTGVTVTNSANVDFRDIAFVSTGAVDLSGITGGSGDAGGNSISGGGTLSFTTADDWYFKETTNSGSANVYNWSEHENWYTATNGGGSQMGATLVVLPQDNVFFDASSSDGTCTVDQDMPRMGKSIDFTGVAAMNLHMNNVAQTIYGSLILVDNVTLTTGTYSFTFEGRNTYTIRPNSNTWGAINIYLAMIGGSLTMTNHWVVHANGAIMLNNGTFDADIYNVTVGTWNSSNSNTRTLWMGAGTWTINSVNQTTPWWMATITGLTNPTTMAETSSIVIGSGASPSTTYIFDGGGCVYNNLTVVNAAGQFRITGSNTFNDFTINGPKTVNFTAGTTQTINGTFSAVGTAGNIITLQSTSAGSAFTLSKSSGTVSGDYLSIQDSTATGGAIWNPGLNSTNVSGNTGWGWPRYWIGGAGNWSDTAHWSASSGGSGGATVPNSSTNVYFDSSSGTGTVTIDSASVSVVDLIQTSANITIATSTNGITVTGNMTVNKTISGATALTFSGTGKTITGGSGGTISSPLTLGADTTVFADTGSIFTISGVISGNFNLAKTGTGSLNLRANNTFSNGLTIKNGAVRLYGHANSAGIGTITIGDTSGTADATLTSVTDALTYANPIIVASGSNGTASLTASIATTFSGAITLNKNIYITTNGAVALVVSGGITGNGNVLVYGTTSGTTTFSTGSVNQIGTITNYGNGTGTTTISAVIGSNVTGVIQNSTTSQLTLSGANTFTGGLTIKAGVVYGTVATGFGAGSVYLGDSSGSANAELRGTNNTFTNPIVLVSGSSGKRTVSTYGSSIFSGGTTGTGDLYLGTIREFTLLLTTGDLNHTGLIINEGGGTAYCGISSIIKTNVTGVIQNSSTSYLYLSGANTFSTGLTIKNGTVRLATSTAAAGTGTITIGDSSGTADATLWNTGNALTYTNPITVASGSSGALTISASDSATFSGAITLNNNLMIEQTSNSSHNLIISGGITGTGNVITKCTGTTGYITISTVSVNMVGTITNQGSGAPATTISAVIGSNVTGVIQNSTTSKLVLSGNNSTVGDIDIQAGTLELSGTTNLNVSDDWSNAGTFTPNSGTVTFTTGNHTIIGANTFNNLTINASNTLTLPSSTTQTISGTMTCTGTAGNIITINSSSTPTQATFSKASGAVNCDYLSLTDNVAEGGATFTATNSTGSNHTGWNGFDITAPTTMATAGDYTFGEVSPSPVTVTLTCQDNVGGSGCLSAVYCLDSDNSCSPATPYVTPFEISSEGTTYVRFYSIDQESNTETPSNLETVIIEANRYWVGGTGTNNWSDTAHWSTSSGGSGGASVPDASTNVYVDTSSCTATCTITMNVGSVSILDLSLNDTNNTVTLATSTNGITVTGDMTVNETISGATALTFSGTNKTITMGTFTISAPLTMGASTTVFVDTGNTGTISGIISESGGARNLAKTGAGQLTLSGANTFTGGLTIKAGTVNAGGSYSGGASPVLGGSGTGTITIGDTSGTSLAILNFGDWASYANPITVASGSSGIKSITFNQPSTINGLITLADNLTITEVTNVASTFTGGVVGTGNLVFNANNITSNAIRFITTSVNHTGTITNSGTGSGTTTISAVIGTNVTGVIQNSATSQLTLSGNNTWSTGGLTIKSGIAELRHNNGAGAGTITIGDTSGIANATLAGYGALTISNPITVASGSSGNTLKITRSGSYQNYEGAITLNNNLTIATLNSGEAITIKGGIIGTGNIILSTSGNDVITLSSALSMPINHTGTITNSGSGSGTTTISAVIGTNVTGVIQNSATSQLTLSGNNTFTSAGGNQGLVIKAGTARLQTSTNAGGAGTITIGDTSGSASATLVGGNLAAITFANPITVTSGSSGTLSIVSSGDFNGNHTFSGLIALNNNLTLTTPSSGASALELSGGVVGTGNIILNDLSGRGILLSNTSINNIGTITNSSTGAGTTTISAVIGSNVTGIIQNSSTSKLLLSGNNSNTGSVTITSGTLELSGTTNLNVSGDFSRTGTFTPNSGKITFTTGTHTLTGATTFYDLTLNAPNTIILPASTTQTITNNLTCTGTAGNIITINSSSTPTQATFSKASGTVNCDYLSLTDNVATGGATFTTTNSTGTNISGWLGFNVAPNAPTLVSPANASYTQDTTPTLSANYSDPDTGDVGTTNYRISTSSLVDCVANTNVVAWGTDPTPPAETPDNNENTTYTVSGGQALSPDATYYWCAQNNDGVLTSSWTQMATFTLDTTPPVTTAEGNLGAYTFNTWTNASVSVSLTCVDGAGSGCSVKLYCLDELDTCTPNLTYTVPVVISTEGTSYIRYASTDVMTNTETPAKTQTIKIGTGGPAVNAGTDKTVKAQFNQDATVTAGSSPIATYQWSKVSGTGTITFGTPTTEDTTVSSDTDGTYVIRLTVTDQASNSVSDDFTLVWDTVNPVANAGLDQIKNSQFIQIGSATDTGGSGVSSYLWSKVSGTGTITFGTPASAETTISADTDGVFVIRLTTTDIATNIGTDDFSLTWDTQAPITTDDFASNDVWTNGNQIITLTPADATSGVSWTKYCLIESCDPATGIAYTVPVEISTENVSYFRYASQDTAGNTQTTVSKTIKIDKQAPVTTADAGTYTFSDTATGDVLVSLTCTDGSGSGCGVTLYCIDTLDSCTPNLTYILPVVISAEGTSYIRYSSTDVVANTETTKSQTIKIAVPVVIPVSGGGGAGGNAMQNQNQTAEIATPSSADEARNDGENQTPSITEQIVEQIKEIADALDSRVSGNDKPQIIYPPIEESVPEQPQTALQGLDILSINPLSNFDLTPVASDLDFFTNKFTQLKSTLEKLSINIDNLNDISKLVGTSLYLPGLTKTVLTEPEIAKINKLEYKNQPPVVDVLPKDATSQKGLTKPEDLQINPFALVQGVPIAQLSADAISKMPSNVVFARTAGELIDFSSSLSISKDGVAEQKITVISGKPIDLVIKPDAPAKNVLGFLILKKTQVSENTKEPLFKYLLASLSLAFENKTEKKDSLGLLVQKFEYQEVKEGVFKASILAPNTDGEYQVATVIEYEDSTITPKETSLTAVVQSEGYVYSLLPDGRLRIKGASVTLYWHNPDTYEYEPWPADKFLQKNPIITDDTGKYSFLVPQGTYYIEAKANGYLTYKSENIIMKENNSITQEIELEKSSLLPGWLNWQVIIIALLILLIALITIMIIVFIKRSKLN